MSGILYVIATPIGNLSDFSARCIETLKSVDLVLCEDTRVFAKLASHYGISTKTESLHDHNEQRRASIVSERLESGLNIALVSDAGTPTISDPGFRVVREAREKKLKVFAIPGPCAAIAALSISGLETDSFYFGGFLPNREAPRKTEFSKCLERDCSSIYYESPHRIAKSIRCLAGLDPSRYVFVTRELTKLYEESLYGQAAEIADTLDKKETHKGEFVIVVGKARKVKGQQAASEWPDAPNP